MTLSLLGGQLLAWLGMSLLLGLPGFALARLLELQLVVPRVLLPPSWFALGLALWSVELVPALAFGWSVGVVVVVHAVIALLLLGLMRWRARRLGTVHPPGPGVPGWTLAGIALATLLAAAFRTRMAFDTLFHLGLVRRLAELPDPTFSTIDRVAGSGMNPAYVLPSWQAAMAAVAAVARLDPATVVEAMAGFVVLLAACAAAALGRVVGGSAASEVAGVAAYAMLRVWFPRRELEGDGIAYAMAPGNVALDVLLPLALVVALLLAGGAGALRRGALLVLAAAAAALLVLLHANYAVYLAIIGLGTVTWLVLAGPWTPPVRRGVALAAAAFVVPGALVGAALLPALLLLEHFAAPTEQRIDYHLVGSGGWQMLRPGHLYDGFGAPGLVAMLLLPWAVLRMRGLARALVGGGCLALLAFGLLPPLLELLGQTGSLTLGLRLPRPLGVLLVAAIAVALPALVQLVRAHAARTGQRRGRAAALLVLGAPLLVVAVLAAMYGYPLARREPPRYGWDWPTLLAAAGLLAVLAAAARRRRVADAPPAPAPQLAGRSQVAATGIAALLVALCLLPSGLMSLRRGAWQARELVAAVRADDLGCYAGIQPALAQLPPGAVVLADPVTAYGVQAVGPVRVIADYKTWNGSTDSERVSRRIEQLRDAFDTATQATAQAAVVRLAREHGARYLVVAAGPVEPPLGSPLGTFDAAGLRAALRGGTLDARLVADGAGRLPDDATEDERRACDLSLWDLEAGPA